MSERNVTIGSPVGLHARPAAAFVKAVAAAGIPVTVARVGGTPVDARSILAVLSLNVGQGDQVVLAAEGPTADSVLDDLATLLEQE
ncbi:HPr family phosphocarrier protein [Plantactinospora sonchi]|uniref:Phosphocarrier protein HPr n=1 Tax=Plantactinospora sonchi TaxID=1544735 RepID=A0ABU7S2C1_9ACTN